jgi:hypothetical protein
MVLTEQNNIACAQIAIYTVALGVGIYLNVKHGFGRSAGWLYLIIFSLVRIVGGALQLAATVNGINVNLLIGASVMASIGIAPLVLILVALLGRVLNSIRKSRNILLQPYHSRLIQIMISVGLILSAIGGANSGTNYASTGVYQVSNLSHAGLALVLAAYALIVLMTIFTGLNISAAEPGEKRIALAVTLALPFVLVRILYPCIGVFGNNINFNSYGGDANVELGMAVIMEMIVIFIVEALGLTVKVIPKPPRGQTVGRDAQQMKDYPQQDGIAQAY